MDLEQEQVVIPDYADWLKKDVWDLNDATYLLCGIEPKEANRSLYGLGYNFYSGNSENNRGLLSSICTLLTNSVDTGVIRKDSGNKKYTTYEPTFYPKTYIEWAVKKELDIPKPLLEWYEKQLNSRSKASTVKKTSLELNENLRTELYVSENRIKELSLIKNNNFDLRRLIHICKELNQGFQAGQIYALPLLVRCILDHIPPIFSCKNFAEVANNYAAGTKSFCDNAKHLETLFRTKFQPD